MYLLDVFLLFHEARHLVFKVTEAEEAILPWSGELSHQWPWPGERKVIKQGTWVTQYRNLQQKGLFPFSNGGSVFQISGSENLQRTTLVWGHDRELGDGDSFAFSILMLRLEQSRDQIRSWSCQYLQASFGVLKNRHREGQDLFHLTLSLFNSDLA